MSAWPRRRWRRAGSPGSCPTGGRVHRRRGRCRSGSSASWTKCRTGDEQDGDRLAEVDGLGRLGQDLGADRGNRRPGRPSSLRGWLGQQRAGRARAPPGRCPRRRSAGVRRQPLGDLVGVVGGGEARCRCRGTAGCRRPQVGHGVGQEKPGEPGDRRHPRPAANRPASARSASK